MEEQNQMVLEEFPKKNCYSEFNLSVDVMEDIGTIEKGLFKNNPDHCGKDNGRQHDGTKENKEVRADSLPQGQAEWVNVDMEMENVKKEKGDELVFKGIIAILILLSPFILLYELGESILFRCSGKRRMKEFRKMESECVKNTNPKERGLYHNYGRYVIHYNTYMEIYPECDVSIWVPEEKVCNHPVVPWQDAMELYSIKVPYKFHSFQADGYVSDLEETDWLADYKKKWHITDAIAVISYNADEGESFFRHRHTDVFMDTFPFEPELTPLECSVELLLDREPVAGLNWTKTKYRCLPLGRFRLERKSYGQLTCNSRKKLERILDAYALPKLWVS